MAVVVAAGTVSLPASGNRCTTFGYCLPGIAEAGTVVVVAAARTVSLPGSRNRYTILINAYRALLGLRLGLVTLLLLGSG